MADGDGLRGLAERALWLGLIPPEEFEQEPWSIGDRYRVEEVLGRGGAGTVFRVVDERVDRVVALKLLDGDALASVSRFQQEIRVLAALEHPGIVMVFDSGLHDGVPYYVMEHAPQGTLAEADLDLQGWVRVFLQVCLAVGAAHKRNIIHRDLKPENVLLIEGAPRVADFGVAKRLDVTRPHATQAGCVVGTPAAMAPEQLGDGEVGPWTDVHALGVMLYQRLTGELPFSTEHGFIGLSAAVLDAKRPDPLTVAPEAPRALVDIAVRALARAPEERFPDAHAMTPGLRDWLQGDPAPQARLQPLAVLAFGVGGLGALALLGWAMTRPRPAPSAGPVSAASPSSSPRPAPSTPAPPPSRSPVAPSASPASPSRSPVPSPTAAPSPRAKLAPVGSPLRPATLAELQGALVQRRDAATLEHVSRLARGWLSASLAVPRLLDDARPELRSALAALRAQIDALPASAPRHLASADVGLLQARFVEVSPRALRAARGPIQAAIAQQDSLEGRLSEIVWALVMLKLSVDLPRFVRIRADKIREHEQVYQAALQAARARGGMEELQTLQAVRGTLK